MEILAQLEKSIRSLVEQVGSAVVGLGHAHVTGSGVVTASGQVLTTAHNVRGDGVTVTFRDRPAAPGRVVGLDEDADLAVVAVDTTGAHPLLTAPEGSMPQIGTAIFALANPVGAGLHAAPGFVCGVGQAFRGPRGRLLASTLTHTAPMPRGSSGGPLVDVKGRLVGLNSLRVDGDLIIALAADAAFTSRVQALWTGQATPHRRLGVVLVPPRAARRLRRAVGLPERQGLLVHSVEERSAAGRAGLARGDLIVGVEGRDLSGIEELYDALDGAESELKLRLVRGTEERDVTVSLANGRGAGETGRSTEDT